MSQINLERSLALSLDGLTDEADGRRYNASTKATAAMSPTWAILRAISHPHPSAAAAGLAMLHSQFVEAEAPSLWHGWGSPP